MGLLAASLLGCAHEPWRDAVGYRARQAALRGDVGAFDGIMADAAKEEPKSPIHDPKRTVLVHFLDLAGAPGFEETIARWEAKGFIADPMTCAIERARWRALHEDDPRVAEAAAATSLDRARAAASDPARAWELEACLGGARFLTESSTRASAELVGIVRDPAEPLAFRRAVLEGLAEIRLDSVPGLSKTPEDEARARTERVQALLSEADRLDRLIALVRTGTVPENLVTAATAVGALRLERALVPLGASYLARHASGPSDLAWAWVRGMKARAPIPDLEPLGLWREALEGTGDAFWYLCPLSEEVTEAAGLGPVRMVRVRTVRAEAPLAPPEPCPDARGPFPLEATARAAAATPREDGLRPVVRIEGREVR